MGFQGAKEERSAQLVERAAKERRGQVAESILRKILGEFIYSTVAVDERKLTLVKDRTVTQVHVTREECEFLRNLST